MAKKPERWITLGSTDWLAAQEWLPPLLAERAERRLAAAAYTAYRNTHPERKRPWEDGYTDKPRSAQEQALAKKAFRIRMSTDETRLKGAIAEIVEKYPTGDNPTLIAIRRTASSGKRRSPHCFKSDGMRKRLRLGGRH